MKYNHWELTKNYLQSAFNKNKEHDQTKKTNTASESLRSLTTCSLTAKQIMLLFTNHNYILPAIHYLVPLLITILLGSKWRAGLVQAVESYRLWPEGPGFESRSPRIAQARVRLATNTLPQTPHRAGALCTGYALLGSKYLALILRARIASYKWFLL